MAHNYRRGEIVIVDLGEVGKDIKGHEQAKTRPCVIVTPVSHLALAIVLPLSTKKPPTSLYSVVKLPKGTAGLKEESFVLCHQIRTISLERVGKWIGELSTKDFNKIAVSPEELLDLP